jgi:hypothetical protein
MKQKEHEGAFCWQFNQTIQGAISGNRSPMPSLLNALSEILSQQLQAHRALLSEKIKLQN